VAVTATTGAPTSGIAMTLPVTTREQLHDRSGVSAAAWLDGGLLRACGGRAQALPSLRSVDDMATLQRIVAGGARLGEAPWHLHFGRELNATDDRRLFSSIAGADTLRVLGGRHLRPFGLTVAPGCGHELLHVRRSDAASRLGDRDWRRWRLGYRDVASPGNRHALIAALIPPTVVTTHTIFVARQPPSLRLQHYLCGVLNSAVANWFVRRYLATHVTSALMARLPVPVWSDVHAALPDRRAAVCRGVAATAAYLARVPAAAVEFDPAFARLQGRVAWLYGLSSAQLQVVFDGTPRLPPATRAAALDELAQLHTAQHEHPHAGDAAGAARFIRP
jgi:hypothetical protein